MFKCFFNSILRQLYLQVTPYSKKFRNLLDASLCDFNECPDCKKFHMESNCLCDKGRHAVRIHGEWCLNKIVVISQMVKLYFKQENETLVHVIFDSTRANDFKEGQLYNLNGWQKIESRHNTVYFE